MHIVFAASECAPWAKTGGLAEVIGSLPREIAALGHKVTVYVPYYRQVREQMPEKKYAIRSITIPFQYYSRFAAILDGGVHDGVQVYFVHSPELFDREFLYGTAAGPYPDNWERFALYCRAVLEASKELGAPDVFHAHDWQAALLPVYLRTLYDFDPVLRNRAVVETVHNAAHQGRFPAETVAKLLFPWDIFTMEKVEFYNDFNFLKGGVVYSDQVTTVSRRYAEEIQTPEYGAGLDGVFRRRGPELTGILNGVDYRQWNPAKDGNIAAHYTPENLEGKAVCRKDLLHAFGAGTVSETTAVMGMVTRMTTQKGIDLLAQTMDALLREDVVLTILGSGEEYYENLARELAERHAGRVLVRIAYDETLAHKVKAGADMLLMPSRFEPCGLTQFHAMKYGTVPVVHGTGGLDDTVEEWSADAPIGTGFKFHGFDPENFAGAVRKAVGVFRKKEAWTMLMRRAMAKDFSWGKSAPEYVEVYERAARGRL